MQNNDVVADRQPNGQYCIRRWREVDGFLLPISGYESLYSETELYRHLDELRPTGDTYVRDSPHSLRLVQP